MKKKIWILVFLLLFDFNVVNAKNIDVSAQSAILIEQSTGEILFEKNASLRMRPASTTKILTAICAISDANLTDVVKISENAANQEGSSMYLKAGEELTMESLIYGLMLSSGNDAAVAIAEHISKDAVTFAKLMNKKAKEIGLINSNFVTPNGLDDDNHYVTAKDLANLTKYALFNDKFKEIVGTKSKVVETLSGDKKYLYNHNKLLGMYPGAIGVKTGFTKLSGRTLVSAAKKDDIILIAVTLNAPNDWQDHKRMLDFGFSNTKKTNLLNNEEVVKSIEVKNGISKTLDLRCEKSFSTVDFFGNENSYDFKYSLREMKAPVLKNEIAGKVSVYKNSEKIFETNLLATEKIDKEIRKNTFIDILKRFFEIW